MNARKRFVSVTTSSQYPKQNICKGKVQRIYGVKMVSSEIKQQVLAIMYGDCYVDQNHNSGKARLDIYHSEKNLDLLMKKKEILEQVNGVVVKIVEKVDNRILQSGETRKGFRLQTNFSRYFYKLYNAPFKYISKQLVKPLALSIMWQDDGTSCWSKKGNFSTATLATDDWEEWKVVELIKAWNNFYGWSPVKMDYKCRGISYIRLRLVKNQFISLIDVISEHCVPSMQYKITLKTLGSENNTGS